LWPINENWYFHAGANQGNNTLENIRRVIDTRYGKSGGAEEFSKKSATGGLRRRARAI